MTALRELEQPLAAWKSFRDIARATRALAAAQALHWTELVHRAEQHLHTCEHDLAALGPFEHAPMRGRVVLAIGSDLGLCGPLNRKVAQACEGLASDPTVASVVVGSRLAALEPLPGAIELPAPSSFEAVEVLATEIEDLCERLHERIELVIVLAGSIDTDAHPQVDVRRGARQAPEVAPRSDMVLLSERSSMQVRARHLVRRAHLVAALARGILSENEARWRTMSRAFEAASRRIDEQERSVRKLRQELITQEMLEARQGARRG